MSILDLKKELKALFGPSTRQPSLVEVPAMNFIMVDGRGDPNTAPAYREAIETLYGLSYTLKFELKKEGVNYTVMPLEGLWWTENPADWSSNKDAWFWTAMIMQPEAVTQEHFHRAAEELRARKNPAALPLARWERFAEGLSAQIMHIGPYSAEEPTIRRLHAFIVESGHALRGRHHEIYLSDPRRTPEEKWRTVIRQPVA
ncbi:MAG: hypothetical protein C4524_01915 [Candidatus Zixiibacteriota bacterium]|nr:MAG: hypothetical protein C4524_01915 [candidate division Zixibacteria bacterium]